MPVTPSARVDWFPLDLQLSSPTTPGSNSSNYVILFLRHTWNGLALFAILVIVRDTVRRVSARRRRNSDSTNTTPTTNTNCHRQYPLPPQDTAALFQGKRRNSTLTISRPHQPQGHSFFASAPQPSWAMAGHSGGSSGDGPSSHIGGVHQASSVSDEQSGPSVGPSQAGPSTAPGEGVRQSYTMMRPPPPPPLTPPASSKPAVFAPEHGALGASLIHQPNPDYHSPTASSSSPLPEDSPQEAGRRSYTRTLPLSIPTSPPIRARNSDSSTSSDEAQFSPRSFPSPTPFLPPPPPALDENGKSADVQGEVVSVTDGYGAGWTRHTRVYGGGVCLACAASGGDGGFYGATALRPEGS